MSNQQAQPHNSNNSGTEQINQMLKLAIESNKDLYIENLLRTIRAYRKEVERLKFKNSLIEDDYTETKKNLKQSKKDSKSKEYYLKKISKLSKENDRLIKENRKLKKVSDTSSYPSHPTPISSDGTSPPPSESRPLTPPDHPIAHHMQQMADKLNSLKSQYLNLDSNWN
ncbi:hypothetical protein CONCODRAFT_78768 [Conidiobolus coronatus NRRL 28638]|uniref:Uncharacterized protein n=1 Tax=Conidiobolus coronatus (strain ATCC 28846 / CBS 209.66 / NRRL 28638) TaxID=796925 RepID=A0A137P6E5_CONC2|nr:hypothetical protein CONCODRAFT_78768 [Conidiobolus coronatus NRRL 28638]|eukprot:KXN70590.1 hypothetical protein CONCODRAFT_78768 [Conidiobolus coronatus NRRL 28638]